MQPRSGALAHLQVFHSAEIRLRERKVTPPPVRACAPQQAAQVVRLVLQRLRAALRGGAEVLPLEMHRGDVQQDGCSIPVHLLLVAAADALRAARRTNVSSA